METTPRLYGQLPSGEKVYELTIQNAHGFRVRILTFGGAITAIYAADAKGHRENVVLAYETLEDYLENPPYLGVTVGRTAGRMLNGQFDINSDRIELETSLNPHALHGGAQGLHRVNWAIEDYQEDQATLIYSDEAGAGKTPGTLTIEAQYQALEEDTLVITYRAMTDQKTYVNVANHSYFNLSGQDSTTILNHTLKMDAYDYAPVDLDGVPLEGLERVKGTPFDFTEGKILSTAILADHVQIKNCQGIDHPFNLGRASDHIVLEEPISKRCLSILTDQAFAVVYSGNYLGAANVPSGKSFPKHSGICFETQDIPNAPNRGEFKGKWLEPGEVYRHETVYCFETCEE